MQPVHPSTGPGLSRHGTLLSQGVTPTRNAAELKSLLGNYRAKIKAGARLLPPSGTPLHPQSGFYHDDTAAVALEQGKSRARVEMDILLDSETYVEGESMTGRVHVKVRNTRKGESVVLMAGGKLQVVGFEGIYNNNDRHMFYQHSAPLSIISSSSHVLYSSSPDNEGFSQTSEGHHIIPFAMKLPLDEGAKGCFNDHSGVVVRYIVIVSFKLKDLATSKCSIAHFYRSCDIYPYYNPSLILASATQPLFSTAARHVFRGGAGKLKLTAILHRSVWVAGQRCYVGIAVDNDSRKSVKGLTLSLIRTTTIFRPYPHLDVASPNSEDPDACQTTTIRKLSMEAILEASQHGLRGHVTEKGWWVGVDPGASIRFTHYILLPYDALSIIRSRLIEVSYAIRVSLIAGSLSSEISVMLPLRIINQVSIDPPPSYHTLFDHTGSSIASRIIVCRGNLLSSRSLIIYV
ncbi:hypothetical protein K439DRAFT_1648288 [Ramaria rubella]|nr:hypothetical protein K439DRAFT_1648288 [Ramaria rubella]